MDHQKFSVSSCSACGTSPVHHGVLLVSDFFGSYIAVPLQKGGALLSRSAWFKKVEEWLTSLFSRVFIAIRLISFNKDISRVASGRSQLIWEEAERRGIEMEQVVFLGKALEHYRAKINGSWFYFQSIPIPPWLIKHDYEARLDDKFILARELHAAGIPTPISKTVFSLRSAQRAFQTLRKPVIVKPRNGSRGRHTTTHITTLRELELAHALCRKIAASMVVQEHLFGSVYRGTVIGGKLVGFFKAEPPRVTGDGVQTIRQLIERQNNERPERLGEIRITDDTSAFLSRLHMGLDTILRSGQVIDLSAKTGRFYGGYTKEMFEEVHPKFAQYFEKAAKIMEAPVVGFDAIMEDPVKDPDSQRWGIIEGNSLPFIDLHYYAFEGKTRDLAPFVWDLWK